ncbi:MAG: hypothetical protein H7333_00410 [Bdellovibrionales bacterium]|nr:hypothetical protein [Oligoflexia bacterium]
MRLKSKLSVPLIILSFLVASCASKRADQVLSIAEQLKSDKAKAEGLAREFTRRVTFVNMPKAEKFLNSMALQLARQEPGFENEPVQIKVHDDRPPGQHQFFSFPGTFISIPQSFLKQVEFENELAAAISYELANVLNRYLAAKVENLGASPPVLFGPKNLFDLNNAERAQSIKRGIRLLYLGGYDPRGMPSIFRRFPDYYASSASGLFKKQVDFNVREAQRAKSEFLPSLKPIVRSGEFIQFKNELRKK